METVGDARNNDVMVVPEQSLTMLEFEMERKKLRQRWELASVLNFLKVFKPVIGNDLKISADDIETALITQNETLSQLHVVLLKGILPLTKGINSTDVWISALRRKLEMWWPWVAEGNFPLRGAKGNDISIYKELDPTTRLLLLKAICEVRADQHDAVSYINDAIRSGTEVSTFQKEKLAGDGNGITFWCDGNEIIGHRLYKEVCCFETERGKRKGVVPLVISRWQTIATNLEEFQKVVDEFSSSRVQWEVALSESIKTDVIPVLKRHLKKKQRSLLHPRKLLNGFQNSGIARSCRNNMPIDYRFDDYDKAIREAIQYANKRKTTEEQKHEENNSQKTKMTATTSDGAIKSLSNSRNSEANDSDFERSSCPSSNNTDDSSQEEYSSAEEDSENAKSDVNQGNSQKQGMKIAHRSGQLRFSRRLAGIPGHTLQESMVLGAKNRLRQRPSINTAVDSEVVPDS